MSASPNNITEKMKHILGSAGLAFVLYIILFSSVPRYDSAKAEASLSELSALLSQVGNIMGHESRMQYSAVEVNGLAYEKWAEISKLSIDFMREVWFGAKRLRISSDNTRLTPHHTLPEHIQLQFVEPINLILGSELLYVINHNQPIGFTTTGQVNEQPVKHQLHIPAMTNLTLANLHENITLQMADGFSAKAVLTQPYNSLLATGGGGNTTLRSDYHEWETAGSRFDFSVSQKTPKTTESRGTVTLDQLTYLHDGSNTVPISINAAWILNETRGLAGSVESSEFIIERSMITDDNMHIAASGMLNFSMDDSQPYGEIILEINDIKLLAATDWIRNNKRAHFQSLIEEIIGTDLHERTQEIIPIQRKKNGEWMIGKTSLAALLEAGLLDFLIFSKDTTS